MVEKSVVVDMFHKPEHGVAGVVGGCKLVLGGSGVFYLEPFSMKVYPLREGGKAAVSNLFCRERTDGSEGGLFRPKSRGVRVGCRDRGFFSGMVPRSGDFASSDLRWPCLASD